MEYVKLSNGVQMPILGYGVFQVTKDECERCVLDALKAGYRLIDTAQSYKNEEEVGNAIAKSGIDRKEIFLTTKVWYDHYSYDDARASVLESLKKLKTDYLDLSIKRFQDIITCPFLESIFRDPFLSDCRDHNKIRMLS